MSSSLLRWFRIVALAEATSFLLLGATYAKHVHEEGIGVSVLGPIHGLLFMAYVILAVHSASEARWGLRTTIWILIGAVVPFGGFVVDRWLVRNVEPVDALEPVSQRGLWLPDLESVGGVVDSGGSWRCRRGLRSMTRCGRRSSR